MKDLLRWFLLVKMETFFRRSPFLYLRIAAGVITLFQYLLYTKARRIIRAGFSNDLGLTPFRREVAVIGSFYHHLLNDIELTKYPDIDKGFVEKHLHFSGSGWKFLQTKPEKSVILLTFHFGPNQIIIPALPHLGYKFTQMGVPPSYWNTLVNGGTQIEEVNRRRTAHLEGTRARFIYVSDGLRSMRKAYKRIKEGGILCIAGDGRIGENRKYDFLGGTIEIALGGYQLAANNSMPLVIVISLRTKKGYRIDMEGPFVINENNLEKIIVKSISTLEIYTRRYPSQYGWMYYAKKVGG
jgi:hypothetical protein